jgi:hypothetical protein
MFLLSKIMSNYAIFLVLLKSCLTICPGESVISCIQCVQKQIQLQKKALTAPALAGRRQSPPDGESQEFFCWLLVVFQLPAARNPNQIHLSNMANFESMPAFAHLFAPGGGGANANAPDASAFNPAASSLGFPMMPLGGYSGFQFPMATPMPCAG